MKICYFTAYTHSWYSLFGKPHILIFCHIYSSRCCKQPSGLLHESHCCMNELTVVFKKSFWDYLSFFTWCVFLPEAAIRRWDTMVTKRWTLSVTILMDAVPFKPCSVGTKGPKVCKENTPHTLYHEPELLIITFLSLADRNGTQCGFLLLWLICFKVQCAVHSVMLFCIS